MSAQRDVHVYPDGRAHWAVGQEGRVHSRHRLKTTAVKVGRKRARVEHAELVVHGRDGRIRDKDSFGRESAKSDAQ